MKYFIIIGLIVLANVGLASASTPNYTISKIASPNVKVGEQEIMTIAIEKQPYQPENYFLNNYSSLIAERFDQITNNMSEDIIITKDGLFFNGLSQGQQQQFTSTGLYVFKSSTNASHNNTIIINQEKTLAISIMHDADGLKLTQDDIIMDGDTGQVIAIKANLTIDDDAVPETYNITLNFTSNNKTRTITQPINVLETKTWKIINENLPQSITIRSGSFDTIGQIEILNTGNVKFTINSEATGNLSKFLVFNENNTLFKSTTSFFNYAVRIPEREPDGVHEGVIKLSGGENEHNISLKILIQDTIPPEIKTINFEHDYLYNPNEIVVETADNIDVDKAIVIINQNNHTMIKDQQLFSLNYNFTKLEPYNISICIFDSSSNHKCQNFTKTFNKLDIITSELKAEMPTVIFNKFSRYNILNVTQNPPEPVNVLITDFSATLDRLSNITEIKGFEIRIVEGDETVNQISYDYIQNLDNQTNITYVKFQAEPIQINSAGQVYLEIKHNEKLSYNGLIEFEVSDLMLEVNPLRFEGRFVDFDIPTEASFDWIGKRIECEVINTGDLETSKQICPVEFPINLNLKELAIPTTKAELDLINQSHQQELEDKNKTITLLGQVLSVIIVFLIVTWGLVFYGSKVAPYSRFRFRKN